MLACLAVPIAALLLLADSPPPAPSDSPEPPPLRVKCATASDGYLYLGGTVTLSIENLEEKKLKDQFGVEPQKLVLYLNHLPLKTLVPEYVDLAKGELHFRLTRAPESTAAWNVLLKKPFSSFRRTVHVSAGTPEGTPLPTDVESMGFAVIQTGYPLFFSINALVDIAHATPFSHLCRGCSHHTNCNRTHRHSVPTGLFRHRSLQQDIICAGTFAEEDSRQ